MPTEEQKKIASQQHIQEKSHQHSHHEHHHHHHRDYSIDTNYSPRRKRNIVKRTALMITIIIAIIVILGVIWVTMPN